MAENRIGLSPEFIIHPGETLQEVLENNNMTQKELAIRAGVSEAFVSKLIRGESGISVSFAKKLEYIFQIDSSFWLNLQSNYEKELYEYQDACGITEEEKKILSSNLKEIVSYFEKVGVIKKCIDTVSKVIETRKALNVCSLTVIPNLSYNGAYRYAKSAKVDPYVMFAWQRLCEIKANEIKLYNPLNIDLLKDSLEDIKKAMSLSMDLMVNTLTSIFQKCGIAFCIIRNFKGAPVQGFIKKNLNGNIILCMTIRQSFADIFWFTLFHEIAHVINGDYSNVMIDYDDQSDDNKEVLANKFAEESLIPAKKYFNFINNKNLNLADIKQFSKEQNIEPFILIGRLARDGIIGYTDFSSEKVRYKWVYE